MVRMTESHDKAQSSHLAGQWQVPLFLLSLVICGLGAWRLVSTAPKPDWDSRFREVVQLTLHARDGDYRPADEAAGRLLKETLLADREHLAKLYQQLAEIRFLGIRYTGDRSEAQLKALVTYYRQALDNGVPPSAEIAERMGAAYADLKKVDLAIGHYQDACRLDPARAPRLKKSVIELQCASRSVGEQELLGMLDDYLKTPGVDEQQYGWAIEQKLDTLIAGNHLAKAQQLIEQELLLAKAPAFRHQLQYQQARVLVKLTRAGRAETTTTQPGVDPRLETAEAILTQLEQEVEPTDELYARVNWLHGDLIWNDNPEEALRSFKEAIDRSPRTALSTAARVGQGRAYGRMGLYDRALDQYELVVEELRGRPVNPYVRLEDIRAAMARSRDVLMAGNQPETALRFMLAEQKVAKLQAIPMTLLEKLDILGRLAGTHLQVAARKKADYELAVRSLATEEERAKLGEQRHKNLLAAGEAFLERANLAEREDDEVHSESLWIAAEAFDNAGMRIRAITALNEFVEGRPSDPRLPEALFRLGQAYQAIGRYDEAISAYQMNLTRYEEGARHPKAVEGRIPMAMCYIAKGKEFYDQAERVLKAALKDEVVATPESDLYRNALFALGRLHYEQHKWREAIAELGEAIQRDPGKLLASTDPDWVRQREHYIRATRSAYLMAQCYYQAGMESGDNAGREESLLKRDELRRAKVDQLMQADLTYQQVIDRLEGLTDEVSPIEHERNQMFRRNSYFSRGDCLFELARQLNSAQRYDEAIARYEDAVFQFQRDPAALGGLTQVYNCYVALGKLDHARAANERAKVLLARMDPSKINNPGLAMSAASWKQWLDSVDQLDPLIPSKDTP